ncbi:MAG TPA: signal peptidase I [Thermoanaerobacterales bacterium]|nr:signal peptidase I [Thermoanaerobacterales bacterium]
MKKKLSQTAQLISKIVLIMLIIIAVTLAFFFVQACMENRAPSVFGLQMYIVMSGSMSPAVEMGSLVLVEPTPPEEIEPGDIITFRGGTDSGNITTHRVIGTEEGNGLYYRTKGDANDVDDPMLVNSNQLIGKLRFAIPYAGYIFSFARTTKGITMLILTGIAIILIEIIRTVLVERRNTGQEVNAKKTDQLQKTS